MGTHILLMKRSTMNFFLIGVSLSEPCLRVATFDIFIHTYVQQLRLFSLKLAISFFMGNQIETP